MMRDFLEYLWYEWFRQVGEALLIAFIVTTFVFTTVQVYGRSMTPTLQNGERVLVPKYEMWLARFGMRQWQRGEIVIVKPPFGAPNSTTAFPIIGFRFRPYFIKRVVAKPGDTIRVYRGQLEVNGYYVDEKQITDKITPYPDNFPDLLVAGGEVVGFQGYRVATLPDYLKPALEMLQPLPDDIKAVSMDHPIDYTGALKIKDGYYFVMGDNRTLGGSEDSRVFGPVPLENIAGRASAVWWPPVTKRDGSYRLNIRLLNIPDGYKRIPEPRGDK